LLFLSFDLPFFAANLFKIVDGGYVPILVGAAFFLVMVTWKRGRRTYQELVASKAPPLAAWLASVDEKCAARIPGAAIFLHGPLDGVPPVLLHHVDRIRVLPRTVVLFTVNVIHAPYADEEAMRYEELGNGFHRVTVDKGFMDSPHVPRALAHAVKKFRLDVDPEEVTYFLGRETFLATAAGRMGAWSEGLFAFLVRNARPATAHFCIPPEQVVEIGSQIDL
jgi:KUP system potassium uptake protein